MVDKDVMDMVERSKTFVNDEGYVMMDVSVIEGLARAIAAQHYMLISSGQESPDNPRLQGQAGVAMILLELVQAIAAKHASEISEHRASETDLDSELKGLLDSPKSESDTDGDEDLTDENE